MRLPPLLATTLTLTLALTLTLSSCQLSRLSAESAPAGSGAYALSMAQKARLSAQARRLVAELSLEARAAQLLLVGVGGQGQAELPSLRLVEELGPGGIILFGFNIPEAALDLAPALAAYQDSARRSASGLPLLVALDHEGGSVFRFKGGITRLPAPAEVGRRDPAYAYLLGRRSGLELRALGVNFALAPVVELLGPENRRLLGGRSYGSDPERVDESVAGFVSGLRSAGLAATAKHFPGNAGLDPHEALPRLAADRASLEANYYPRFASAIRSGVDAIMISHLLVPALDPELPATLSRAVVEGELRGRLGFQGLVLTDDLFMKALGAAPERSAILAVAAGADLLMLSAGGAAPRVREALVKAVEEGRLPAARLEEAARRVVELKLGLRLDAAFDAARREEARLAFPRLVEESAALLAAFGAPPPGRP